MAGQINVVHKNPRQKRHKPAPSTFFVRRKFWEKSACNFFHFHRKLFFVGVRAGEKALSDSFQGKSAAVAANSQGMLGHV